MLIPHTPSISITSQSFGALLQWSFEDDERERSAPERAATGLEFCCLVPSEFKALPLMHCGEGQGQWSRVDISQCDVQ